MGSGGVPKSGSADKTLAALLIWLILVEQKATAGSIYLQYKSSVANIKLIRNGIRSEVHIQASTADLKR